MADSLESTPLCKSAIATKDLSKQKSLQAPKAPFESSTGKESDDRAINQNSKDQVRFSMPFEEEDREKDVQIPKPAERRKADVSRIENKDADSASTQVVKERAEEYCKNVIGLREAQPVGRRI